MTDPAFDAAPGFDQPIAVLKHCHDKIRRQLATLQNLLTHIPEHGADADARQAAAAVRKYFNEAAPFHHADEEENLLPMLQEVAAGADSALLDDLAPQIIDQHHRMDALWRTLDTHLAAIAGGTPAPLPAPETQDFSDAYSAHMTTEETCIAPMALRLFSKERMAALGAAMQQRRGIAPAEAAAAPAQSSLAHMRIDYKRASLSETDVLPDPIAQFGRWFEEALAAKVYEANSMCLSTVNAAGRPSSRIMLIKDFDERGFTWYTNYLSRKGDDLSHNPYCSLLFFWSDLERQVRIEGRVEKVSDAESDAYFQIRPLASRLGAIASRQSQPVADRATMEKNYADAVANSGDNPARPPNWGGFRVIPDQIEFWQGRSSRFHDRIIYTRQEDGSWQLSRLQP